MAGMTFLQTTVVMLRFGDSGHSVVEAVGNDPGNPDSLWSHPPNHNVKESEYNIQSVIYLMNKRTNCADSYCPKSLRINITTNR